MSSSSFSPCARPRRRGRRAFVAAAPQAAAAEVAPLPLFWPAPPSRRVVLPVFLPFRGCPVRCVFCAQDAQTGRAGSAPDLRAILAETGAALRRRAEQGCAPVELAFYGGTFTALPEAELHACLALAATALERGWAASFRCSTRPDRLNAATLQRLREVGCTTVELGVQSFADTALAASRRGYDAACARRACARVLDAGLQLGVQLLPGMPGHTPEMFRNDVEQALDAGARMLRFYPCLVLEGTALAALWREGRYAPWPLDVTLEALARGWLAASAAGVPVIRMGLAPEPALRRAVLDGPADPALGSRVMGRGLLLAVRHILNVRVPDSSAPAFELLLPRAAQGCLWGHRGELRAAWAALGLHGVRFVEDAAPAVRIFTAVPA